MPQTRLLSILCYLGLAHPLLAQSSLFIITSDFATGSTALWDQKQATAEVNLLNVHADAVGTYHDGKVYIINRLGQDNILVLDETDLRTPLTQFSVGNGANPNDIEVVAPDKAYVTGYDTAHLLIVNPQNGSELGRIDLSPFADGDGLPEVSQIVRIGQRLYLTCQRLDRDNGWVPADDSFLIVVDLATDDLVDIDPATEGIQGIVLSAPNPSSAIALGDKIAVAVVANFGDRAGGIDLIDTATNQSRGLVIGEQALGGDINSLVMATQDRGYAVISDENFAIQVRPVNIASAAVGAPLEGLSGGFVASMAVDGNRLIVGDRGSFDDPSAAGLKIFDTRTGAPIAGPISTGLPPASIVVLGQTTIITAVEEQQDGPDQFALESPYPNPFNASVLIPFQVHRHRAPVELTIYDMLGRPVRTLISHPLGSGSQARLWDGRNNSGQAVGNGAYMVRLRVGHQHTTTKVMLLK